MNELRKIIDASNAGNNSAILATVVDVVGSSYRRPGARMLILPDGSHIGTISGGCLERDLCREAKSIVRDGPKLISFDTRSDSTNFNPRYNLGCAGIIYVLVERISGDVHCPLAAVRRVFETGHSEVIGTVYQSDMDRFKTGMRLSNEELVAIDQNLRPLIDRVATRGQHLCVQMVETDNVTRLLIERIDPPRPLIVFGAGDDAIPVSSIAAQMGWSVTVIDDRPEQLTAARFPNADRLLCTSVADAHQHLAMTQRTVAVVMTHSFSKDVQLLPWLLKSDACYVGLLGPKSRTGKIIKQLYANDQMPAVDEADKLHTPVGLDIGAVTPAEIAVSIVSEVIAKTHCRCGGKLGQRNEPIHPPVMHELIELASDNQTNVTKQLTKVKNVQA